MYNLVWQELHVLHPYWTLSIWCAVSVSSIPTSELGLFYRLVRQNSFWNTQVNWCWLSNHYTLYYSTLTLCVHNIDSMSLPYLFYVLHNIIYNVSPYLYMCVYVLMYDYIYVLFVCRGWQYIHRYKCTGTGDFWPHKFGFKPLLGHRFGCSY